ncbi:hypothetical protein ACLKA6_007343, partial [Drosophila palustris]
QNNLPPKTDYCMPIEYITTGKSGALTFYTDGSKLKNQELQGRGRGRISGTLLLFLPGSKQ